MARPAGPARVCERAGCGRKHLARGLCGTHYNQEHQSNRHRKVVIQCGWCGKDCEKEQAQSRGYKARFCSTGCRDAWRADVGDFEPPRWKRCAACPVWFHRTGYPHSKHCVDCTEKKVWQVVRATRPRWVAGNCRECGEAFVDVWLATASSIYCSARCAKRQGRRARRARLYAVRSEPYRPIDVFRRDGWRCHICKKLVIRTARVPHNLAPTVDHLVPIAEGGDDVLSNVACAHFICNARRSNTGGAQLILFGDVA